MKTVCSFNSLYTRQGVLTLFHVRTFQALSIENCSSENTTNVRKKSDAFLNVISLTQSDQPSIGKEFASQA